jgi:hypothetical protein
MYENAAAEIVKSSVANNKFILTSHCSQKTVTY